ncbi:MAG: hypothetical protein U5L96_21075 [Owenweeksia sp.]|nr:hypothetical protein [Owenweeksia sp.]
MKKILCHLFIICGTLWGQKPGEVRLLGPAQLQEDFEIAVQSLAEVHPALYQYTTQNRLEKLSDSISKNQLSDSLSEAGFHIILRKYISNIGCGHTVALPSRHWYKKQGSSAQLLPFNIDLIGERLFINHTSPGDSLLKPGDEILMINGRSTAHILSKMRAIISGDGRGYRFIDYKIKRSFRTYYLFYLVVQPSTRFNI